MTQTPMWCSLSTGIAQVTVSFNVTTYYTNSTSTTESQKQITIRTAGTFSLFQVTLSANTIATSNTTIRTRINAANGNQSVTIPAGSTGIFQDTTNSDIIVAGDKLTYQCITPNTSGSITIANTDMIFSASNSSATSIYYTRNGVVGGGASSTFCSLHGSNLFGATEANVQTKFKTAGTLKNLFTNVTANTRWTNFNN